MEASSSGSGVVTIKNEEIFIGYSFLIRGNEVQVTLETEDLINLLEKSGQVTLNDLGFEAAINVKYTNGHIESINIHLPEVIMNATAAELRNNPNLYTQPYCTYSLDSLL